ncbi:hypothetical protein [Chitinophaga sp. 212800010-3]|uniref:hypothetical protein n=1 Tax=unclassified Chitinophaga TaxID=2619133 RepID=UPI002DEBFF17|nr:DUF4890 domain-containing protein [Chitinophaga sp. 212800010-3]
MKFISMLSFALLTCMLAVCTANAQVRDTAALNSGRWTVEGRADKITDKISHKLGLSKDQSSKIYDINEDIIRRKDEVKKNASLTKKDRMAQIKALDSERSQRFKTVLTAGQYKKWNDWEMNKKEHLEQKMDKKKLRKEIKNSQR